MRTRIESKSEDSTYSNHSYCALVACIDYHRPEHCWIVVYFVYYALLEEHLVYPVSRQGCDFQLYGYIGGLTGRETALVEVASRLFAKRGVRACHRTAAITPDRLSLRRSGMFYTQKKTQDRQDVYNARQCQRTSSCGIL